MRIEHWPRQMQGQIIARHRQYENVIEIVTNNCQFAKHIFSKNFLKPSNQWQIPEYRPLQLQCASIKRWIKSSIVGGRYASSND